MAAPLGGDFGFSKIHFPGADKAQKPIQKEAPGANWQPEDDALYVNFTAPMRRAKDTSAEAGLEVTAPAPKKSVDAPAATPQASRVPTLLSMEAVDGINGLGHADNAGAIQGINGILSASGEGFSGLSGRQYTFH